MASTSRVRDAMKAVLSTFERLPLHFDSALREQDYESLIKATCDRSNITRVVLRGFGNFLKDFVKIGGDGSNIWKTSMRIEKSHRF